MKGFFRKIFGPSQAKVEQERQNQERVDQAHSIADEYRRNFDGLLKSGESGRSGEAPYYFQMRCWQKALDRLNLLKTRERILGLFAFNEDESVNLPSEINGILGALEEDYELAITEYEKQLSLYKKRVDELVKTGAELLAKTYHSFDHDRDYRDLLRELENYTREATAYEDSIDVARFETALEELKERHQRFLAENPGEDR